MEPTTNKTLSPQAQMHHYITHFPDNMTEALRLGREQLDPKPLAGLNQVVICGLGGSGIGGQILANVLAPSCSVPVIINGDYTLPAFADVQTLVVACSYSGNTEETLAAISVAMERQCTVVAVTSDGQLLEWARQHHWPVFVIPGGQPPRTSFGYNATMLFFALHTFGIISDAFMEQVEAAAALLGETQEAVKALAKAIASDIAQTTPIIYSAAPYEGVAIRWRQQINENAKTLCWHHVLPEMNHNELVGWAGGSDRFSVLMLRNSDDHPRTQKRMELCRDIIGRVTPHVIEVWSVGDTPIEKAWYLIHLGDWLSYYLAEEKGVDPMTISVIDYLKGELAGL